MHQRLPSSCSDNYILRVTIAAPTRRSVLIASLSLRQKLHHDRSAPPPGGRAAQPGETAAFASLDRPVDPLLRTQGVRGCGPKSPSMSTMRSSPPPSPLHVPTPPHHRLRRARHRLPCGGPGDPRLWRGMCRVGRTVFTRQVLDGWVEENITQWPAFSSEQRQRASKPVCPRLRGPFVVLNARGTRPGWPRTRTRRSRSPGRLADGDGRLSAYWISRTLMLPRWHQAAVRFLACGGARRRRQRQHFTAGLADIDV